MIFLSGAFSQMASCIFVGKFIPHSLQGGHQPFEISMRSQKTNREHQTRYHTVDANLIFGAAIKAKDFAR